MPFVQKNANSEVSAAILAGGLGTRLRAVVSDTPKTLALARNRPFLVYLLDQLRRFSVSEALLCTGYLGEMIESCFGEYYQNLHLVYSREVAPLGTAGAIRLALPLLKNQQVLVLNGDSYCDIDLQELLWRHREQKATVTMAVTSVENTCRYGTLLLNENEEIIAFAAKGRQDGPGLINAGIYVLERRVIEEIPFQMNLSLEKDVFPKYVGKSLRGYVTDRFFIDIGTPADYERAQEVLPAIPNEPFRGKQAI